MVAVNAPELSNEGLYVSPMRPAYFPRAAAKEPTAPVAPKVESEPTPISSAMTFRIRRAGLAANFIYRQATDPGAQQPPLRSGEATCEILSVYSASRMG